MNLLAECIVPSQAGIYLLEEALEKLGFSDLVEHCLDDPEWVLSEANQRLEKKNVYLLLDEDAFLVKLPTDRKPLNQVRGLQLITDSQEIEDIIQALGGDIAFEEYPTGILVKINEGEVTELWCTWSSRPWDLRSEYERYL